MGTFSEIRIRQSPSDGTRVQLIADGRLIAEMPYQAALELGQAFRKVGKLAETEAQANRVIADGALLLRGGAPFNLSNDPRFVKEIIKEASWGKTPRRYFPHGIKSEEYVGLPTITQTPPRKLQ